MRNSVLRALVLFVIAALVVLQFVSPGTLASILVPAPTPLLYARASFAALGARRRASASRIRLCPAGTFAYRKGSRCCRVPTRPGGRALAYDSPTCGSGSRHEHVQCPAGNAYGSCADNRALEEVASELEVVAATESNRICAECSGGVHHGCLCTERICEACELMWAGHGRTPQPQAGQSAQWRLAAEALADRAYVNDGNADAATFGHVEGVLKWVSGFDRDQNALLCNDEVRIMPRAVRDFVPRYDRMVEPGAAPMCLRFNMVEAALWKLPRAALARIAAAHWAPGWYVDNARAYKFQGVPDWQRRCQWPFVSEDGAASAATWVYHGEGRPWRWAPADVRTGDVVAVRGPGVSRSFWANVHPHIKVRYIALVQTEAEDVTPGVYAARAADESLGYWYMLNHDEKHVHESAKLVPLPIGQIFYTDAAKLFAMATAAPPPLAAARTAATVLILFTDGTSPDRARARAELRRSLGGSGLLSEPAQLPGAHAMLEHYAKVKFVVSPWGAGPDCHRTWEAIAMGAVPIVRSHKGLAPLFAGEPVVVVERWADVTPMLLATWKPPAQSGGKVRWGSKSLLAGFWHKKMEAHANALRADVVEARAARAQHQKHETSGSFQPVILDPIA
jgi:hypothetical protein